VIYSRRQFLSLRSLIFASRTVCHCMLEGTSAPPHSRNDVINNVAFPPFRITPACRTTKFSRVGDGRKGPLRASVSFL
jgi:hypothetical protein